MTTTGDARYEGWIRLDSGGPGGRYGWRAAVATPGGGWRDAPELGRGSPEDDPAVEVDQVEDLPLDPGPVVWARRVGEPCAIRGMLLFSLEGLPDA